MARIGIRVAMFTAPARKRWERLASSTWASQCSRTTESGRGSLSPASSALSCQASSACSRRVSAIRS